ncbi:CidA/LrgA family holin-like protein [Fictibacillus fluitans]|uniref:CidA/LrgA family holin-like protein n=1 Tax=Fictibacillus fluitans TaxID=3058422 RepID=A0ABT8I289_9BACL|nr:CidA/LrgA family holin-like protein [Fictibacillus sp. NE201]MDN4527146.1 CidA/LrgA family holin-like protein [Fictibacillus sp. NE201]
MKAIRIILQIAILFAFSLIGEGVNNLLHLPVSGSIVGLILMLICLTFKIVPVKIVEDGASFLLSFLPLLFIPAMAGVMNYPALFSGNGLVLLLIVVLSTLVTMVAAGIASQMLENNANKGKENDECNKHLSQS